MGHALRSCILGMRIARRAGMSISDQADLYYALLLKDAGCSSNASKLFHLLSADEIRAKRDVKLTDWSRVGWDSFQYAVSHIATGAPFLQRVQALMRAAVNQKTDSATLIKIRCERGASIARRIGFSEATAAAIHSLDEHWNGGGYPDHLAGAQIPLHSRIMNLSQTLEVFLADRGPGAALDVAKARAGRWFDPDLVRAARSLGQSGELWVGLDREDVADLAASFAPNGDQFLLTEERLESICGAFGEIVDAKSPYTYNHSTGVAAAAASIAGNMGLGLEQTRFLRRAALLHDIGKLSVSNAILEKPGKLEAAEWEIVKRHPYYSYEILRRIPGFEELSIVAGAHHERLDGSGYFRNWDASKLSTSCRILAVADVYDALAAKRPYRDAMPREEVFALMRKDAPHALDAECLEALIQAGHPGETSASLAALAR